MSIQRLNEMTEQATDMIQRSAISTMNTAAHHHVLPLAKAVHTVGQTKGNGDGSQVSSGVLRWALVVSLKYCCVPELLAGSARKKGHYNLRL